MTIKISADQFNPNNLFQIACTSKCFIPQNLNEYKVYKFNCTGQIESVQTAMPNVQKALISGNNWT